MNALPNVVTDFGAVGDGVTDNTAAMTAAHATGVAVAYPPGNYKHRPIAFASGGIVGLGGSQDVWLTLNDTTGADGITMTGTKAGIFSNFSIKGDPAKTAGSMLVVDAPVGSENWFTSLQNVYLETMPSGIVFKRAAHWSMNACVVREYKNVGVSIDNKTVSDSGDSSIVGCTIVTTPETGTVGVRQYASGGLKVTATKILGGAIGYEFAVDAGSTSIVLFSSVSIETKVAGAMFRRTAGSGTLAWLSFSACEIRADNYGIACDASLPVTGLSVVGSHLISPNGGPGKFRVYLGNVNSFNIAGNVLVGSGVGDTGIISTHLCSNGRIYGLGSIVGFTTPVSLGGTNISAL